MRGEEKEKGGKQGRKCIPNTHKNKGIKQLETNKSSVLVFIIKGLESMKKIIKVYLACLPFPLKTNVYYNVKLC